MAQRKDVFQSKVLHKLYPNAPTEENKPNPVDVVETLANKPALKRKTSQNSVKGDGESLSSTTDPARRVYTALPPPADYHAQGASITHPQPESVNSGGEAAAESSDDTGRDGQCEEHRTRRKRRGKKSRALHEQASVDGETGASELKGCHPTPDSRVSAVGGGVGGGGGVEHLSKNRRRKLKKKRHKEKLRSLGLVSRTSALEFTYRKEGEEEEEEGGEEEEGDDDDDDEEGEEEGRGADEVSQFLRSTMEIYLSDGSVHPDRPPLPTSAVQKLLSDVADGGAPPSILKQLARLMRLVQRKEASRLARALEDLHTTSFLSPEETAAVVRLFRYWITDLLPMQRDAKE
ncbi:hypothetical protein NHX12_019140 [Muraenolepis orangiensis]|uniref:Glutamate-rich protein 1 n=1 Tax=Muraenolepis orangiensis TaxID=630683 RepID=A0A9Q0IWY0_9TELE|nr:hypothetical protein NHX12_019140 [Muraenolepis orangiensis]